MTQADELPCDVSKRRACTGRLLRRRVVEFFFFPLVNPESNSPTSSHLPVFHLEQRPPRQRLCLMGLGVRPWQFSSGTLWPAAFTQLTLRDLKPRPQPAEHCKTSEGEKCIELKCIRVFLFYRHDARQTKCIGVENAHGFQIIQLNSICVMIKGGQPSFNGKQFKYRNNKSFCGCVYLFIFFAAQNNKRKLV